MSVGAEEIEEVAGKPTASWRVRAVQGIGFVVGLGLFVWAVRLALSEENRPAFERLAEAPAGAALLFFAVTAASVVCNGALFWITVRPMRRLGFVDMQAVNAIATFLAVLPFKISVAVRFAVHVRRDGMTIGEVVAWFAAMTALTGAVLVPIAGASLWRGELDVLWWGVSVAGPAALLTIGVVLGRASEKRGWLAKMSLGSWRIVREPAVVMQHAAVRVMDVAAIAARFGVAAGVAGFAIGPSEAVLLGATYFVLGVAVPVGQLGTREAGTTAVAALAGLEPDQVALLTILMTATEAATAFVASLPAAAWLRLDRVLMGGRAISPR